jgi:hypothetical protein
MMATMIEVKLMPVIRLLKSKPPPVRNDPTAPPMMAPTMPNAIIMTRPVFVFSTYWATQPAMAPMTSQAMIVTLPTST